MNQLRLPVLAWLFLAATIFVNPVSGQVVFDESVDGELSNDRLNPTEISLSLGTNVIAGEIGENGQSGATDGSDADFFTFELAAGLEVDSIAFTRSGTGRSFVGYAVGDQITSPINSGGITAGGLFSDGDDASTVDGVGLATIASILPLQDGDHTFVFQETASGTFDYSVSFNVVSAVPEPSSIAILSFGGVVMMARRRRHSAG